MFFFFLVTAYRSSVAGEAVLACQSDRLRIAALLRLQKRREYL
jgi:hypothetical protein